MTCVYYIVKTNLGVTVTPFGVNIVAVSVVTLQCSLQMEQRLHLSFDCVCTIFTAMTVIS